jgi:hypothetical protein
VSQRAQTQFSDVEKDCSDFGEAMFPATTTTLARLLAMQQEDLQPHRLRISGRGKGPPRRRRGARITSPL